MNHLISIPTFGYETAHYHCHRNHSKECRMDYTARKIGDYICKTQPEKCSENNFDLCEHNYNQFNQSRYFAYIPFFGTLYGLLNLYACCDKSHKLYNGPNRKELMCRSVVETLSLGFLLIIPDLIATFNREWVTNKPPKPGCFKPILPPAVSSYAQA